ncbi:MAG TPA: HPF/RaiA family ribosome-associated protein [Patescibacteria group bacterium]
MTTENTRRYLYRGVTIDDRTYEYIEKKIIAIEKILEKVLQVGIEIDLDKKGKFRVEVMVRTPYRLYRAEDTTASIEGSIDLVETQLKNQIKSAKDRRKTLIRKGGRLIKENIVVDEKARK